MDLRRDLHHRLLNKRQGLTATLEGVVNGLTSTTSQQVAATSTTSHAGDPFNPGKVFSSLIGDISSLVMPSSGPSAATSSVPLTVSSSSSSAYATPSAPLTPSSTTSTSTTPTPPPSSTSSVANTVYTTTDGTRVVYVTSTLPSASATSAPHTSFSQNPSMKGGIFALVGIVALVVLLVVVTWTLRKRRRDRLERDLAAAVSFDPGVIDRYELQEDSLEKRRLSGSSSGHNHGHGYGVQLPYLPQQEYHGPVGYPTLAYNTSPNPAPYQPPSPTIPQPVAQGGANLTRKFSDRKPVPPLLPNHPYDPSNAHVSIPPQFYQQ